MKYRIKIVTFKNNRKLYYAQVKMWYGWRNINYDGENVTWESEVSTLQRALARIDKHYSGNASKQSIEFEYINKP